jgi:TusA-related sulfurtransferase/DNA-binding transcriptional ArsR family regulator
MPSNRGAPVSAPAQLLPERRRPRREDVSVARALGSTTRAGIYEHLQEAAAPLTVRDVAAEFDLHPNVARTHLELLADAGLVTVGRRKHPGGGRPAKVYAARDEAAAQAIPAEPADGAAAELVVRLLVNLLEDRGGAAASQAARAHEVAAAEGRRLVARLPARAAAPAGGSDGESRVQAAGRTALAALRPLAPAARIVRSGEDFLDVAGVAGALAPLAAVRPGLVEPLERGLVAGALAGAGVPVSLTDVPVSAGEERVLRARVVAPAVRGTATPPATTVDARGGQREAGVVRAMRAVTGLRPGEVLEVLAEGPGSPAAFARWADRAGHELLGVERATDPTGRPAIRLLIRKGR